MRVRRGLYNTAATYQTGDAGVAKVNGRMARLGRVRPVLRLGERTYRWPSRHTLLAEACVVVWRSGARTGVLQSLLRDQDLRRTLLSVQRVLRPGGLFVMELVPDVPRWRDYDQRVRHLGRRRGGTTKISLVESVRQGRSRQLTVFE